MGRIQAVVGIVLSAAASVAIGSGLGAVVGVPLLAYSADLAAAGINQAATGEQTNTFFFEGTKKTAKGFGASEEQANNIAIGTDILVGGILTGGASNVKNIGTIPKVVAGGGVVAKGGRSAVGGKILKVENSPYLIVQKGDRTFHISPDRVKEYVKNPLNPNSRWGDQVNFKKYGVPEGSEVIQGAGKGHKRTPTKGELNMFNNSFNK